MPGFSLSTRIASSTLRRPSITASFLAGGGGGGGGTWATGGGGGGGFTGSQTAWPRSAPMSPPPTIPPAIAPPRLALPPPVLFAVTPPAMPPAVAPMSPPPTAQAPHCRSCITLHPDRASDASVAIAAGLRDRMRSSPGTICARAIQKRARSQAARAIAARSHLDRGTLRAAHFFRLQSAARGSTPALSFGKNILSMSPWRSGRGRLPAVGGSGVRVGGRCRAACATTGEARLFPRCGHARGRIFESRASCRIEEGSGDGRHHLARSVPAAAHGPVGAGVRDLDRAAAGGLLGRLHARARGPEHVLSRLADASPPASDRGGGQRGGGRGGARAAARQPGARRAADGRATAGGTGHHAEPGAGAVHLRDVRRRREQRGRLSRRAGGGRAPRRALQPALRPRGCRPRQDAPPRCRRARALEPARRRAGGLPFG